jgi:hypothetical protein
MSKPREYWIAKLDPYDGMVFDKDPTTFASGASPHTVKKVIEYSAYEKLEQENAKLKEQLKIAVDALENLLNSKFLVDYENRFHLIPQYTEAIEALSKLESAGE